MLPIVMSFDHRAHVGLAFDLLRREGGITGAAEAFRALLGHHGKYDHSVTRAYLAIIADRMGACASSDELLASHPDLLDLRVISRKP